MLSETSHSLAAGRTITADAGMVLIQGTDGFGVLGTFGSGATIGSPGAGTRMFFNPNKAAFRTGNINSNYWNDGYVGNYSFAAGNDPVASGHASSALGWGATASGFTSLACGMHIEAESANEVVFGKYDTDYTPNSSNNWDTDDRLLVVGNGISAFAKSDALVILKNGNMGIMESDPSTALEVDGGLTLKGDNSITVTSSGQNITIGNRSLLVLDSDNTPANRDVQLSNGLVVGQTLIITLITTNSGDGIRIPDLGGSNVNVPSDRDLTQGDTITLIWNGGNWLEIGYSDN